MKLAHLVEVTDKDGKVIQRISAPSRSFVRQWYDIMTAHADAADRTCKDTDGISRTISPHEISWFALAGAAVTTHGIRVGKGTTAVSISDYKLENPIRGNRAGPVAASCGWLHITGDYWFDVLLYYQPKHDKQ